MLRSEYFEALDRLIKGTSKILPKGTKITNDAVSLEAGRSKGSIKKSRAGFSELIEAIDAAAAEQVRPNLEATERLKKEKSRANDLRAQLDAALAREMSLVYESFETKKKLHELSGEKVTPIRSAKSSEQKG